MGDTIHDFGFVLIMHYFYFMENLRLYPTLSSQAFVFVFLLVLLGLFFVFAGPGGGWISYMLLAIFSVFIAGTLNALAPGVNYVELQRGAVLIRVGVFTRVYDKERFSKVSESDLATRMLSSGVVSLPRPMLVGKTAKHSVLFFRDYEPDFKKNLQTWFQAA